ncbi:hypothetical protein ACH518_00440 (plasmid) [Methylomonas sp. HW2-6]|uniref:hypothetical protein n=1 Tax=Methylomonas sp. HW2-6 TaxID=3376687 RepID=UPI00404349F5
MSMDINVFLNELDDLIVPIWLQKMQELGMSCQIHPEFSFSKHSGFLPFKINIQDHSHPELIGKDYYAGFEFYYDDFDVNKHIKQPKQSWLDKLLKKPVPVAYFANAEIDQHLKKCTKSTLFNFGSSDTFDLRMALLASATITEVTKGICWQAFSDTWPSSDTIVSQALKEVCEYENSLTPEEFRVHEFKGWS